MGGGERLRVDLQEPPGGGLRRQADQRPEPAAGQHGVVIEHYLQLDGANIVNTPDFALALAKAVAQLAGEASKRSRSRRRS